MSHSGHLEVYRSGLRYRWRRVGILNGKRAVLDRADHGYVTRWSAKRGARRAFPDLPVA